MGIIFLQIFNCKYRKAKPKRAKIVRLLYPPKHSAGGICILCGSIIFFLILLKMISGCSHEEAASVQTSNLPEIYPDYINVTIPNNIAPLNFKIQVECQKVKATFSGKSGSFSVKGEYKIDIPLRKWKRMLEEEKGDSVTVSVSAMTAGEWCSFKPFYFHISEDKIDPYLSYRLIEPGYEVWNMLQIRQRNIENFNEKVIIDNNLVDGGCINCHTYSDQNPSLSFFHLRHINGGTMIQKNGVFRKIKTTTDSTISAGVYGSWHPSGRFLAFSTNVIIPGFHSIKDLRLEVYDTISDVIILDIDKNEVIKNRLLAGKNEFETFPAFSADGQRIFFCSARKTSMPENYRSIRYSLCALSFYPDSVSFGTKVDTLISSFRTGKSVSQPKPSPDGKYILFTSFNYGNFPVWHKEADLHLLRLSDLSIDTIPIINSNNSDSYHSWSSGSRWFVFASKRDNGMYGKPYFAHIDEDGKCSKPFLLPQRDADFYDFFLKSYNIPELARGPVPFSPADVERAFRRLKAEPVICVSK
jgi:hypothetical protein